MAGAATTRQAEEYQESEAQASMRFKYGFVILLFHVILERHNSCSIYNRKKLVTMNQLVLNKVAMFPSFSSLV